MGKERSVDWKSLKQNHQFVRFCVSILLIGLAFRLLYSKCYSIEVPSVTESPFVENTVDEVTQVLPDQISQKGKCDIFTGNWIPDPIGPFYTNESCHEIESPQNCMKNGRPDTGYLYWRWKPRDCDIPRFNAKRFLNLMQNKSWAFIGDSICRNHVQSLLCILSKVEGGVEVFHDKEYKSRTWHFPTYNFTLAMIWSPFLLKANIFEDMNGVSKSDVQLHLDKLDRKWADLYQTFDYVIISGGKWFLKNTIYYENNKIVGCHNCRSEMNLTEYGFDNAYRKALEQVFNFIVNSNHNSLVFFRTASPDHFENGEWFSGGTCNRTVPFKGDIKLKDIDGKMRLLEYEEFKKAVIIAESKDRVNLKLLDTTRLSSLRPDGHPGSYREPFSKGKAIKIHDCLHWCLPGPIDTWNDLIMEMVKNG